MGMSQVTYNGFTFPDRSDFKVSEEYRYDDAGVTIVATRFRLTVTSIIISTDPSSDVYAGTSVQAARQKLSQPGQELIIEHDGFGPTLDVNSYSSYPVKDIAWGPKPRIIVWEPIGHTMSVEIVWEVEFEIPVCNGTSERAKFNGVAAHNYSVNFQFDKRGYTTRTINGYIEIALTRSSQLNRLLQDSVDNYRDELIVPKPNNFHREVSWNCSEDKRRADYTITDSEIDSPNVWPAGVVNIQAQHTLSWQRQLLGKFQQTLSAVIELAPDQPKERAWLIFKQLFTRRLYFSDPTANIINSLQIVEDIYANRVAFQVSWHVLAGLDLERVIQSAGLFQPVCNPDVGETWTAYDDSIKHLQPFRGISGKNRAVAGLRHHYESDKILDLCDNQNVPQTLDPTRPAQSPTYPSSSGYVRPTSPYGYLNEQPSGVFYNKKPDPERSWLVFNAQLELSDNTPCFMAVQLAENDLDSVDFDPKNPNPQLPKWDGNVGRWVEENAGVSEIIWTGYAERFGHEIPKPGRIRLGNAVLKPTGKGKFSTKFLGSYFGQPKYGASWRMTYVLSHYVDVKAIDGNAQVGG